MSARPRSTTIAVPSLHVQIQRYSTQLLLCTNTKIYYILVIIYKYKDAVHTYYYLQIQRYIKYLSFFTNTKIQHILIIIYKYKGPVHYYYYVNIQRYCTYYHVQIQRYVHTYYHVQIQRYSTFLLLCTNTNVQYILITMYKYKGIVHTYYLERYMYSLSLHYSTNLHRQRHFT